MENKTNIEEDEEKEVDKVMAILKNPTLLESINEEFDKTIADEEDTRKVIFLGCMASQVINFQSPMNILVSSESSTGKSWVSKKVCEILPENIWNEDECYRTKISPETFAYWHNAKFEPDWDWDGKVCYLEDLSDNSINSDTFKVMASEGSVSTVVKDQRAIDIKIKGKPIMLVTAASADPNFETINRFYIISLDETEEQTKKIMEYQAKIARKGFKEIYNEDIKKALACLKRIKVKIPFADSLVKFFPKKSIRMRRDFPRFLDLIKCSVALYQFQRKKDDEGFYIAEKQDYEISKEALEKIKSSSIIQGVAGLTHRQKKCFYACLNLSEEKGWFSAREIHAHAPFISKKSWYDNLDKLLSLKLLNIRLAQRENSDKKVTEYTTLTSSSIELPSFSDIVIEGNELNVLKKARNDFFKKTSLPSLSTIPTIFTSLTSNTAIAFNNAVLPNCPHSCSSCGLEVEEVDWIAEKSMCRWCASQNIAETPQDAQGSAKLRVNEEKLADDAMDEKEDDLE